MGQALSSPESTTAPAAPRAGGSAPMSQRQVLQTLSGLLMGIFVAILSSTVVSTSLPRIIADLGGGQSAYTWVVTSTLLATTVSTPLWGKFADLFDRKLLLQLSLLVFVFGSALAGLSQNAGMLIAFRVVQGLGAGGLSALVQVVIADIISPRERGKYMGILGGVTAVGTVGGPLLGGVITDSIGWRWTFYVGVPIAAIAIVLIQKTLRLPARPKRTVSIDYLGATLITAGVSLLLLWVSFAGSKYDWVSTQSALMVVGSLVLLALAVVVESRTAEPILPLGLFRNRTVVLAIIASAAVGVAMFGGSVFLSQYMQLARGKTPTESGLMTIPLVAGSLISSIGGGQLISRTGKWKPIMIGGSVILTIGLALMGTMRADTNFVLVSLYMMLVGLGTGLVMQNLVLIVQNVVSIRELGAASSAISFFRSLGGTIGVSAMGAVLGSRVGTLIGNGLADAGVAPGDALASGEIPTISELPEPVRGIVEGAYGEAVGNIFLLAAPLAIITVVALILIPNTPLGTRSAIEQMADEEKSPSAQPRTSNVTADYDGDAGRKAAATA